MKKIYILISFLLLSATSLQKINAQTAVQNLSDSNKIKTPLSRIPTNLIGITPHMPNSNEGRYEIKKEEWIKNFPDEYVKLLEINGQTEKHIIDKKEFDKMPADKRNEILSHPDRYQIVEINPGH